MLDQAAAIGAMMVQPSAPSRRGIFGPHAGYALTLLGKHTVRGIGPTAIYRLDRPGPNTGRSAVTIWPDPAIISRTD